MVRSGKGGRKGVGKGVEKKWERDRKGVRKRVSKEWEGDKIWG